MEHTDARTRVLDALSEVGTDSTPVAVFTQSSTLSQMKASGASWPHAHSDPTMMARLGSAQHDMFGFDSVRVPFCVTVEASALGCDVDMGSMTASPTVIPGKYGFDPFHEHSLPSDMPSRDDFIGNGRVGCVSDAVRILSTVYEDVPTVAGTTGPLTILSQILGAENMVLGTMMCPDIIRKWSRSISDRLNDYILLLEDSGTDVVLIAEASGSLDLICPDSMMPLTGDFLKGMSSGRAKRVLHMCGDIGPVLDDLCSLGFDGLSLEGVMDPHATAEHVHGRAALIGNIGPVDPLLTGTPEDVLQASKRSLDAGFDIIAPGCGVPVQTPDDNLRAILGVRHQPANTERPIRRPWHSA